MRIFHIATVADWERAKKSGAYTTSTWGRSLEEEGFLHAAHLPQVQGVFQRFYRDVGEPLLLLTIDTERLGVPWREVEIEEQSFPHIYGPLSPRAVVGVQPLNSMGGTEPFASLFVREMLLRIAFGVLAMLLAVAGSIVGAGSRMSGAISSDRSWAWPSASRSRWWFFAGDDPEPRGVWLDQPRSDHGS